MAWNEFEKKKINKTIAFNISYVPHNIEEVRHEYGSKHKLRRKNQVILLMITGGEKYHHLAAKSLSALFRGIISKQDRLLLFKLISFI